MQNMQSSNPALAIAARQAGSFNFGGSELAATIEGTTTKTMILVGLTMLVGYFSMNYALGQIYAGQGISQGLLFGSCIVAFIVAMVACFKPELSKFTAPAYAVCEGAALGLLSGVFEFRYPGIVSTAVMSTFVVVLVMLALWKFKLIVPTQRFRSVVMGATLGIAVLYFIHIILNLFGVQFLPSSGPVSIGISLIICTVAALNLILDFENMQISVEQGLPKYFEYFNAFSILVTICWLYIEILKLLAHREE